MTSEVTGPLCIDFNHRVRTGNTKILAREMQTHVLTKPLHTCPGRLFTRARRGNGPHVSGLGSNKTWQFTQQNITALSKDVSERNQRETR